VFLPSRQSHHLAKVLVLCIQLSILVPQPVDDAVQLVDFVEPLAQQELQPADVTLLVLQFAVQKRDGGLELVALAFEWHDRGQSSEDLGVRHHAV